MILGKRRKTTAPHRDLLERFAVYTVSELGLAQRTAKSYSFSLKCLSKWAGKPLEEITAEDLRAFKREADYKTSTKQQVVVAHQFHKWGVVEGLWEPGSILAIRTPRYVHAAPKPPVSPATALRMLEACRRPLEYRLVYLGLYAGLRIAESASVDESNWRRDRIAIVGKGSKPREVPLHPELVRVRDEILAAKPASVGVLHSSLVVLRERINVVDEGTNPVTSHALRRTCATEMYDYGGVPYEVVAKLLGHGADVTARYARIGWDRMKEAIAMLDYQRGETVQLSLF